MDTIPLDQEGWKTVIAYSQAHITMVDEATGLVLNGLDNLDLTDSTIVFAADHNDMEVAHNRFGKDAYFYEEVWRIPLIIRALDTAPAIQEAYASLLDVSQTLFSFINGEVLTD